MKTKYFTFTPNLYKHSFYAVLIVAALTFLLLLIGLDRLGEAVITLLYLVPIVWCTVYFGKGPGMSAALTAALLFAFFFRPPYYDFALGSLNDWLVLAIFLAVAGVVVAPIQSSLSRAQTSEREAIIMYELNTILVSARTQEAVAYSIARFLQQKYMATLVTVSIQPKGQPETAAYEPYNGVLLSGRADCVLSLVDTWGFVGEIQIWKGKAELPLADSRLFHNFVSQIGQALERIRLSQAESIIIGQYSSSVYK